MSSLISNRDIGARLRGFRRKAGYSIAELSALLQIHANTLKKHEAGLTEVGAQVLCAVAQLGWDVNYILLGKSVDKLASEIIDWSAVIEIFEEIDELIELNQVPVTPEMRRAMIRNAYQKYCDTKPQQPPEPVYVEPRSANAG
jgi:transcriptional regulator with XRE-family HTH domain